MKSFMATSDRPSLMRNSSLSVNYDLMGSDTVAPLTQYKLTTDRYTLTRKGETAETAGQPTREVDLLSEEERASFSQDEGKSERVTSFKQHFAFGKIHVKPPWHLHATPHENCEHPVYVDWLDNLEPLPTLKRQIELSKKAVADHKAK
ncbi:hypothetical protein AGDE_15524 [Angomonas deanei]|nr:hypothetical protein AGDE_15524 [Angomonas deanei]|eukprot:EPY18921.1 hypothetical protein AGDE_15524 [Angomonas deanei]